MTTGIIGLRQNSPAAMRILAHLQFIGPATRWDLAKACHTDQRHAAELIRAMRRHPGMLHIGGWVRPASGNGPYAPVYAIGPGKDKPKPRPLTGSEKSKRRRNALLEKFGDQKTVNRICKSRNNGGASRVVIDGVTLYERGVGVIAATMDGCQKVVT